MLQLKNITKKYIMAGNNKVQALKGVSINFRKNEFVSILGPSGCGKTTLLNIIGGLDHYTTGDLVINGQSTKNFKDKNWDNYRNKSIGFVFQSYNLIPHLNLQNNVAMGLALSGMSKKERLALAKEALAKVGLGKEIKKRPNQLSGGQMQRVAIARAIVGNPDIILADEPTGALDSETGVQIMELLKEIANDKLIIMVTHNADLAKEYSTRIINILDGKIVGDSNPYSLAELRKDSKTLAKAQSDVIKKKKKEKVGMSIGSALGYSTRTLSAKKGRTFITSIAGSIGIFAISLVLAISAGMTNYVNELQSDALGTTAITISETATVIDMEKIGTNTQTKTEFPSGLTGIYPDNTTIEGIQYVNNNLSTEFLAYLNAMDKSIYKTIEYSYSAVMNIISKNGDNYKYISTQSSGGMGAMFGGSSSWYDIASQTLSNEKLITDSYDILYKTNETGLPKETHELMLVVDKYNQVKSSILTLLGFDATASQISYEDLCGKEFKLILNNDFYKFDASTQTYVQADTYENLYNNPNAITLKIVGVARIKNSEDTSAWLSSGIVYSSALTNFVLDNAKASTVGQAQLADTAKSVLTGQTFIAMPNATVEEQHKLALKAVGAYSTPVSISIYPTNVEGKQEITNYINAWNNNNPNNKITYTDYTELLIDMMATLIDAISYVLIAFCAISLVVSTVMISVTTYTSVIERTKEIGVLRALGARKKDISRIFNSETISIGFLSGVLGVILSIVIGLIINLILNTVLGITIVKFEILTILIMITISTVLTLIAGLIPAKIAAKKDPVICLRSE